MNNAGFYGFVDPTDTNRTALIYACMNSHEAVVRTLVGAIPKLERILLNSSTIVNIADWDGRTPLHYAAANGQWTIVKILLKKGAKLTPMDDWGLRPKALIEWNQKQGVVDILTNDPMATRNLQDTTEPSFPVCFFGTTC